MIGALVEWNDASNNSRLTRAVHSASDAYMGKSHRPFLVGHDYYHFPGSNRVVFSPFFDNHSVELAL